MLANFAAWGFLLFLLSLLTVLPFLFDGDYGGAVDHRKVAGCVLEGVCTIPTKDIELTESRCNNLL
jgi:hypothetical protein